MLRKSVVCICLSVLLFLFIGGKKTALPPYVYLNLDVRLAPDLDFPVENMKKDIRAGMEKEFSDRGMIVVEKERGSDFKLEFTIEAKHFYKSQKSFSILFKAKHVKVSASGYQGVIPPLTFDPFSNRDRSGGVKPAQDLDDAVDYSLKDLLFVMKDNGIFAFRNHPIFSKVAKIDREEVKKIKTREDFNRMADRIIKEIKQAIAVALKAKPSPMPPITQFPTKDYSGELGRILKELKALKRDKKSLDSLKRAIEEKLKAIDKINYVNTASIIIETNAVSAGSRSTFEAVIVPNSPCSECGETEIRAANLGRITSEGEFDNFAREQRYRIPYRMKGKIDEEDGQLKVIVSRSDYKKIFDIDRNGRLEAGAILKSINDKSNLYPRILIKTHK